MALCGVVAHYLTADFKARATLIGLKRVMGTHSGENITEAVLKVIQEYGIAHRIGCFQADNAGNNDTCIEAILRSISPSTPAIHRRLRCHGHVINLSAKAFLFGHDPDAFELEIDPCGSLALIDTFYTPVCLRRGYTSGLRMPRNKSGKASTGTLSPIGERTLCTQMQITRGRETGLSPPFGAWPAKSSAVCAEVPKTGRLTKL
jgi:hypothetical protein